MSDGVIITAIIVMGLIVLKILSIWGGRDQVVQTFYGPESHSQGWFFGIWVYLSVNPMEPFNYKRN